MALAVLLPASILGAKRDDCRPNPISLGQTHPKNIWCNPSAAQILWRGATVCPRSQQRQPHVGFFSLPVIKFYPWTPATRVRRAVAHPAPSHFPVYLTF